MIFRKKPIEILSASRGTRPSVGDGTELNDTFQAFMRHSRPWRAFLNSAETSTACRPAAGVFLTRRRSWGEVDGPDR